MWVNAYVCECESGKGHAYVGIRCMRKWWRMRMDGGHAKRCACWLACAYACVREGYACGWRITRAKDSCERRAWCMPMRVYEGWWVRMWVAKKRAKYSCERA